MKILNGEFHNIGSVGKPRTRGHHPEGPTAGPGNMRTEEMSRLNRRMEVLFETGLNREGAVEWELTSGTTSRLPPQAYDTPLTPPANNGEHYETTDVTWQYIDLHITPSAHTPSNSSVNEISSPSTYTNTDGYTVSYYILCSFLR